MGLQTVPCGDGMTVGSKKAAVFPIEAQAYYWGQGYDSKVEATSSSCNMIHNTNKHTHTLFLMR